MKSLTILLIILISITTIESQTVEKHKWENRIMLVISEDENSQTMQTQLELFNDASEDMKERKLIIYKVLPSKYKVVNKDWIINSNFYETYNSKNENFKIVLIGLDGSIKLEQNEILTTQLLFSKIDKMPMRRAEIKDKN